MLPLTRIRSLLVVFLLAIVIVGTVVFHPQSKAFASRVFPRSSALLAALRDNLGLQEPQRPTAGQDRQGETTRRGTQGRTTSEGGSSQAQPPCVLPPYFEDLSSSGQTAYRIKMGCVPTSPSTTTQAAPSARQGLLNVESTLANVQVNDPAVDLTNQVTQSETTLVLAGSNIIVGFNDSGSFLGGAQKFTGFALSTNGGASFIDKGALPTTSGGDAGDPVLARSEKTGTVLFATLSFSGVGIQVFRSTDNGVTFSTAVNGAPGRPANDFLDKCWLAFDNSPGPGFGNAYIVERDFGTGNGIFLTRSTDDGLTWGPNGGTAIVTASPMQGAFVTVGADHAVYVFWYAGTSIKMRKSTDFGATFGSTVTVAPILSVGTNGDLGLEFRSSAFPQIVAHPSDPNQLYMVYGDNPVGADRADSFFTQSTDGGATWSPRTRINTDATTNDQWLPSLGIKPDGSALAIAWYDRRSDPANKLIERWARVGTISGTSVTFGPEFVISDKPFLPVFGQDPQVNPTYMGDYDQVVADNTFFYTTWGDSRLGTQDVRFAKFTNAGPDMAILGDGGSSISGGNGDSLINPNECNTLTVTVINKGTQPANDVSVTISSTTPGVYTTSPTSAFPPLPAGGGSATNLTPLRISTGPDYVCGTPVVILETITSSAGMISKTITLPGAFPDYVFTTMTGQSIVPGDTLVPGTSADDATASIALPFSYSFYNQTFSQINVSTNGNLQFSSSSTDFNNVCLPAAVLNNTILPYWQDLDLRGSANGIFTSVSGTAPNRIFNIEWRGKRFNTTTPINLEVRLYEGQKTFDMIYAAVDTGVGATVGVQKDTGSQFTSFSCKTASLSTGLKITGTLPNTCVDGGGKCLTSPLTSTISDPLLCSGDSNTVSVHAEYPNPVNTPALFTFTAPLPLQLIGIPGACISSAGTCVVTPTQVTVTGTLAPNQILTVDYKVRVANGTPQGTNLCITSTGRLDVDNNGTLDTFDQVTACTVLNCPTLARAPQSSDQKPGSVLVFPYYSSGPGADTRITLTNTSKLVATPQNPNYSYVHLMFIDGATCQQADQYVCLTPNASLTIRISEFDPGVTGWILAVAVDAQGLPIKNNVLVGNAFVSDGTYQDNYGAEAFAANSNLLAAVVGYQAILFFDGASYDAVPGQFAVEIQSPVTVPGQKIVTVGLNGAVGNQMGGALQVGTGLVINGKESPTVSFNNFLTGACQATGTVSLTSPRVPLGMAKVLAAGQSGTMIFNVGSAVGLIMTPKATTFGGIRPLHKIALTTSTITIPIFLPTC